MMVCGVSKHFNIYDWGYLAGPQRGLTMSEAMQSDSDWMIVWTKDALIVELWANTDVEPSKS